MKRWSRRKSRNKSKSKGELMEKRCVKLTLPEKLSREPVIYELSHDFNVIPNIRRGYFALDSAWVELELEGNEADIEKAIEFLRSRGITVELL